MINNSIPAKELKNAKCTYQHISYGLQQVIMFISEGKNANVTPS